MHKLVQLEKIIEERIASLKEEIEIATNVRLSPLYIDNLRDEIQFIQWTMRHVRSILNQVNELEQEKLGETKQRQELADIIEFENILGERIQELNLKLKDSDHLRESDILINEIDTLECVLGHLSDLKYGDVARGIEIAEANRNFNQAKQLRDELCDIHDIESEISAKMQSQSR
jgi:DNA repair exonuclease SbcCD ATPase subunit